MSDWTAEQLKEVLLAAHKEVCDSLIGQQDRGKLPPEHVKTGRVVAEEVVFVIARRLADVGDRKLGSAKSDP